MSTLSSRRSLLFLVAAVVIAFVVGRISLGVWLWSEAPEDLQSYLARYWTIATVFGAAVLVGAGSLYSWLILHSRRRDKESERRERLAELGLLSGGLAHEIRNTLNAMRTHIALASKHTRADNGAPISRQLAKLEQAVGDLEELTTDFLTFARPATDKLEEVDLRRLIDDTLDFVALDLEQGRVRVKKEVAELLPAVYVDCLKIKRAILNLIVNARQAMQNGGTLTIRAYPSGRQKLVLEIADTGCGIPPDEVPKIFQTFFSTKPDGTGLGLATVKRTVEDCGGEITFETKEGEGTMFRISLPLADKRRLQLRRLEKQFVSSLQ